jgi:PhnB protein
LSKEAIMTRANKGVPQGLHSVTPQLIFDNTAQAIDWYKKTLGAKEISRAKSPDGKQIMHAEVQIGDSRIYMNDAMGGGKSAKAFSGLPMTIWVYTENCDTLFNRAVADGAKVEGPMGQLADQFWGDRTGTFTDPFGYRWCVATRKEDLTEDEMQRRAADFFKNAPQPAHH